MTAEHHSDPLLAALVAAQEHHHLFRPAPTVAVIGVSGGADSVCLMHALAALARRWEIVLHVAHVDHSLRPTSRDDADFVRDQAQTLGLPFHCLTLAPGELQQEPGGSEAAARRVRHRFLHATALNVTPPDQVPHVVLAHHAEDQAETVLLRLVQGAGLRGLGGMRPVSRAAAQDGRTVCVVRPLLAVRRAVIFDYLARHNLAWREDPTNADPAYARNRLRHHVMPHLALINPGVTDVIVRTAELLGGEAERLAERDAGLLHQLTLAPADAERLLLDLDALRRLPPLDQRGVLHQALGCLLAHSGCEVLARDLGSVHVEALRDQVTQATGAGGPHPIAAGLAWSIAAAHEEGAAQVLSLHAADAHPFPPRGPHLGDQWRSQHGCRPIAAGSLLLVGQWQLTCTLAPASELPAGWSQNSDRWRTYLDAEAAGTPCLTTPVAGMRLAPLGMGGQTRALGDLFTDRKIPESLRIGWPIVVDGRAGQVLWVCGVQPAHTARVTATSVRVLCLAWSPLPPAPAPQI